MSEPKRYILKPEQFAFMQAHHEQIERGSIEAKLGSSELWNALINSPEYARLFGDMLWDDVLDRYEETPGYDPALRLALHEQLRQDVEAGRVTFPPSKRKSELRK